MAFALQINAAAATKKKTAAPKKTTVKKVRSCLFRAGLFPTGFRFFFLSLAQNGCLLQREKKRDQKTNQKSATFASSRRANSPQKPPFRRRQTRASNAEMYREYIGARFDAAASVARRSRGGPFFRQVCSKNKSRKRFAKFLSSGEKQRTPTTDGEKNEGKN